MALCSDPKMVRSFLIWIIATAALANASAVHAQPDMRAARKFVVQFYNWYPYLASEDGPTPAWRCAVRKRANIFSDRLNYLLDRDFSEQDKCDDLIGLDFDPFLNTQDPAPHYEVGRIKFTRNGTYFADVYGIQAGIRRSKPDVDAVFRKKNAQWQFIDFFYQNGGKLSVMLSSSKPPCSVPRKK